MLIFVGAIKSWSILFNSILRNQCNRNEFFSRFVIDGCKFFRIRDVTWPDLTFKIVDNGGFPSGGLDNYLQKLERKFASKNSYLMNEFKRSSTIDDPNNVIWENYFLWIKNWIMQKSSFTRKTLHTPSKNFFWIYFSWFEFDQSFDCTV